MRLPLLAGRLRCPTIVGVPRVFTLPLAGADQSPRNGRNWTWQRADVPVCVNLRLGRAGKCVYFLQTY